jgi:hypothetical protein
VLGAADATVRDNGRIVGALGTFALQVNAPRATITGNVFEQAPVGVYLMWPSWSPDTEINHNTFQNNGAAGILVDAAGETDPSPVVRITGNHLLGNGAKPIEDFAGVNDGIHVRAPAGSHIELADNAGSGNAGSAIEVATGSVIDGRGNTAAEGPAACIGVSCAKPPG